MRRAVRERGPHVVPVLISGVVAVAAGVTGQAADLLSRLEGDTRAVRFQLRADQRPPEIVVVAVDDVTFSDLGLQWPFPRRWHARAIDQLRKAGVRTIAYDVQFTEPTNDRDDVALYNAVRRAGNVVLATSEVDDRGRTNVLGGEENLAMAHARAAASNLPAGPGGVFEKYTRTALGIPTFAVAAAEVAGGPRLGPSDFESGGAWIDYRGPPRTIRTLSFSDLVRGRVDPKLLRGRIVVVGASSPALQDVHPTPPAPSDVMAGPEIQANAIWTALHRNPLRSVPPWVNLLAIIAAALLPAAVGLRARPLAVALVAPLAAALWLALAQLAFTADLVVGVVWPMVALVVGTTGTVAGRYLAELGERRRVTIHNELLERRVRERTEQLRETQLEIVQRLAQAAESRDTDTGQHIERMSCLCERLGLAIGMSEHDAELLRHASALHDVGKIGIPDRVLLKEGRLEPEEREVMNTHPDIGASILAGSRSELLQLAEVIARTHHERWDGTGYPAGLRSEEIPLPGRICTIADVFDALTSSRPYKPAWSVDEALAEIQRLSGRQFDPALVRAFMELAPELRAEYANRMGAEAQVAGGRAR